MTELTERLDVIRGRLDAATPRPWRWAGNIDTGEPRLTGRGCDVLAIGEEDRSTTGRRADEVRSYALESGIDPEAAVADWALDRYDQPVKEPRLWFYTDHFAATARDLVVYEVAPTATDRDDPRVYRADITDIRHPDAQLIVHAPTDLAALLGAVDGVLAAMDDLDAARAEGRVYTYGAVQAAVRGAITTALDGAS